MAGASSGNQVYGHGSGCLAGFLPTTKHGKPAFDDDDGVYCVFFFPSLSFFFCVFFIYLYFKRWMDGTITLLLGTKSFVATVESGVSGGIYNVPFI